MCLQKKMFTKETKASRRNLVQRGKGKNLHGACFRVAQQYKQSYENYSQSGMAFAQSINQAFRTIAYAIRNILVVDESALMSVLLLEILLEERIVAELRPD